MKLGRFVKEKVKDIGNRGKKAVRDVGRELLPVGRGIQKPVDAAVLAARNSVTSLGRNVKSSLINAATPTIMHNPALQRIPFIRNEIARRVAADPRVAQFNALDVATKQALINQAQLPAGAGPVDPRIAQFNSLDAATRTALLNQVRLNPATSNVDVKAIQAAQANQLNLDTATRTAVVNQANARQLQATQANARQIQATNDNALRLQRSTAALTNISPVAPSPALQTKGLGAPLVPTVAPVSPVVVAPRPVVSPLAPTASPTSLQNNVASATRVPLKPTGAL